MLSLNYQIDEDYLAKTPAELRAIGESISRGQSYVFDEVEIQRVIDHSHVVESITPKQLCADLAKWLGAPFLIVVGIVLYFFL